MVLPLALHVGPCLWTQLGTGSPKLKAHPSCLHRRRQQRWSQQRAVCSAPSSTITVKPSTAWRRRRADLPVTGDGLVPPATFNISRPHTGAANIKVPRPARVKSLVTEVLTERQRVEHMLVREQVLTESSIFEAIRQAEALEHQVKQARCMEAANSPGAGLCAPVAHASPSASAVTQALETQQQKGLDAGSQQLEASIEVQRQAAQLSAVEQKPVRRRVGRPRKVVATRSSPAGQAATATAASAGMCLSASAGVSVEVRRTQRRQQHMTASLAATAASLGVEPGALAATSPARALAASRASSGAAAAHVRAARLDEAVRDRLKLRQLGPRHVMERRPRVARALQQPARVPAEGLAGTLAGDFVSLAMGQEHGLLPRQEEVQLATAYQRMLSILRTQQQIQAELGAAAAACALPHAVGCKSWAEVETAIDEGRAALRRLRAANVRLVVRVALDHKHQGIDLQDAIAAGTLGLQTGLQKFDPSRGYRLSTSAYWWIRNSITKLNTAADRSVRLPSPTVEQLTRLRRAEADLRAQNGNRPPTQEELCQALRMSRLTLSRLQSVPQEAHMSDDSVDALQDAAQHPWAPLESADVQRHLLGLIRQLPREEAGVLLRLFGLLDGQPATQMQVARELQVPLYKVRQHLTNGMARIQGLPAVMTRLALCADELSVALNMA